MSRCRDSEYRLGNTRDNILKSPCKHKEEEEDSIKEEKGSITAITSSKSGHSFLSPSTTKNILTSAKVCCFIFSQIDIRRERRGEGGGGVDAGIGNGGGRRGEVGDFLCPYLSMSIHVL